MVSESVLQRSCRGLYPEGGVDACWEPEPCCQDAYNYDLRTPGLFKEEFTGDGIEALNSKTYYCWNDKTNSSKYSSKGIYKSLNNFTKDTYLDVLKTKASSSGVNKGFVVKDSKTYTYEQVKTGLTYFYAKRQVGADRVSTSPIDI